MTSYSAALRKLPCALDSASKACNRPHLLTAGPDEVSRCQALVAPSEAPARVTQILIAASEPRDVFLLYWRWFPGKIAAGTAISATGVAQ